MRVALREDRVSADLVPARHQQYGERVANLRLMFAEEAVVVLVERADAALQPPLEPVVSRRDRLLAGLCD